jgi:hypothetical protein
MLRLPDKMQQLDCLMPDSRFMRYPVFDGRGEIAGGRGA